MASSTKGTRAASRLTTPVAEDPLASTSPVRPARARRARCRAGEHAPKDLAQRVAEIEARLAATGENGARGSDLTDEALASVARRLYRARLRRARHLPPELFGEPAWDILLDLFLALVRDERIRTSSAILAARTSGSTGLRCLSALEAHGLVERHTERGDRRVRLIRLSPLGYQRMRAYLAEGIDAGELPAGRFVG